MHTLAMILAGEADSRLSALRHERTETASSVASKIRVIDLVLPNRANPDRDPIGIAPDVVPVRSRLTWSGLSVRAGVRNQRARPPRIHI
jgi:hypothetical protein